jgi:hypothetical protein
MLRLCLIPAIACLLLSLASCGKGDPGFIRLRDYENDAGEAAVRHLITKLPDPAPGVPKEYCVMIARDLRPATLEFQRRFADTKLPFVNGDALVTEEVTRVPKNPKTGVTPYVLQISYMHLEPDGSYTVEMGWAYKKQAERVRYVMQTKDGKWTVAKEEPLPLQRETKDK